MTLLNVYDKVKIHYKKANTPSQYILDVIITAICSSDEFKGLVERVFAVDGPGAPGEITTGEILLLKEQEITFKLADIR